MLRATWRMAAQIGGQFSSKRSFSWPLLPYANDPVEYETVLNRAAMRETSWASKEELDQVLDAVVGQARRIMPIRTRLRPTLSDPADDMVLECAVQVGADAIVTMNVRDFLPARELYRVDVIKPGELFLGLERGEMK